MDLVRFRSEFPEFADTSRYTASVINFWAGIGEKLVSAQRFGDLYDAALGLFTAHNIALAFTNKEASAAGGNVGGGGGIISSKAVGSVNVSYDTASAMETGAGHWNQTTYGRQYIRLARMIGAGCVQL